MPGGKLGFGADIDPAQCGTPPTSLQAAPGQPIGGHGLHRRGPPIRLEIRSIGANPFGFGQRADCGRIAANRAVWIARQPRLLKAHRQQIDHEQRADQRLSDAQDQLERLVGLQGSEQAGHRSQHPRLRAGRHRFRVRHFRKKTTIARSLRRGIDRKHPRERADAGADIRFTRQHAGIVHQIFGGESIGTFDQQVMRFDQARGIGQSESLGVNVDPEMRVERKQAGASLFGLGRAAIRRVIQNLPLKIAQFDLIGINDAQATDSGGGQVQQGWRAQATGADHQHARPSQFPLTVKSDLGQNQMPSVAQLLFDTERAGRVRGLMQRTGHHEEFLSMRFLESHARGRDPARREPARPGPARAARRKRPRWNPLLPPTPPAPVPA